MSPQVSGAWRYPSRFAVVAATALLIGVLLLSGAPLAMRQAVSAAGLVGGSLAIAASSLNRLRRSAGRRRPAWGLFGLAGLLAAGSNLEFYLSSALNMGSASVSTALLLLALLSGVAGVLVYPSAKRRLTDLIRMLLDGLVIGGSVLFIASLTVFPQVFAASSQVSLAILALFPPVVDVTMATFAALLYMRTTSSDRSFLGPVSIGFCCYALSDFAFALAQSTGAFTLGSIADLGWIAGYLLIAVGLRQASVEPQIEAPREASPVLGTAVTATLFITAAVIRLSSDQLSFPVAVLWLAVLLAMTGRQIFLIVDNENLRQILESRVIQRSHELRQVTQQSDLLVNSVGDGIYGVDRDGLVTFVNPAAAEILRYPAAELIGRPAHHTFHASQLDGTSFPADACYITEAIRDLVVTSAEEDSYVRADGHQVPVEVTATPLTEDDQVRGAVVVFRDITQRREMDRLKSEFVSMVSHELRTPLTAIRGSLGLLAGGALGGLDQRAARMVRIALDSSERLSRLINDILDVERIEAGVVPMNPADHEVADLIDAAVSQVQVLGEQDSVSVRVLATPGRVHADADWVQQTLLNLLGNAIKFSPPHGVVDVYSTVKDRVVEIAIRDQGRGVPEDKLDAIFARFEQVDSSDRREKGGTGLGLAISRSLVERLGGRIWAENNAPGGATFRFTLPRPSSPEVRPAAVTGRPGADLSLPDGGESARDISTELRGAAHMS